MKNKYIKYTHISERKFREILRFFSLDIEARKTAELTGLSRQSISKFYTCFRERIAELCEVERPFKNGEVELDESYFGLVGFVAREGAEPRVKLLFSECSSVVIGSTLKSSKTVLQAS